MKRDWDLVFKILDQMEEAPANQLTRIRAKDFPDYDENTINEHLSLLANRGLIDGRIMKSGTGPIRIAAVFTEALTWEGHDFIANARTPGVWERVKTALSERSAEASYEIVRDLAAAYARQKFGL